jgi:hypothetical protein
VAQLSTLGGMTTTNFMKTISASIIVLVGALLLLGSDRFASDTQTFIMVVGCGVGVAGFVGWFMTLKEK